MAIIVGLAVGLIIGGLLICFLSAQARGAVLSAVFWWTGLICAVVGLVLLVTPVLNWVYTQLRSMIGH